MLKKEETTNEPAISTFVPPNSETRLGTVPAVTYRPQSSSARAKNGCTGSIGRSADKENHSSKTKVRTGQSDRGDDKHLEIRDKIRDDEYQPTGGTTRQEFFDVVEAHTFSLAYIQTGPDEIQSSDGEICSRCHEDVECIEIIRQRTVFEHRRELVDSSWYKLQP